MENNAHGTNNSNSTHRWLLTITDHYYLDDKSGVMIDSPTQMSTWCLIVAKKASQILENIRK